MPLPENPAKVPRRLIFTRNLFDKSNVVAPTLPLAETGVSGASPAQGQRKAYTVLGSLRVFADFMNRVLASLAARGTCSFTKLSDLIEKDTVGSTTFCSW